MNRKLLLLLPWVLAACHAPENGKNDQTSTTEPTKTFSFDLKDARPFHLMDLPDLAENVRNDTLLVYTTHDLGNGQFVIAAKHVDGKREGLRLILYRPRSDSSAEVLAVSKPAYDSEVMLPTYFSTGDTADGIIILANYGGLQSWGQNVFWLKDGQFKDLGWLDVAERGWKTRLDSLQQWRTNIAPKTNVRGKDGRFEFTFSTDSVQLYDDLNGRMEVMLPSDSIAYLYDGDRMVLVVDGKARYPKEAL